MSLCIRAIPSKLTSLAGTRNQVIQLDRRLTKLISMSTHFQECGGVSLRKRASAELTLASLSVCKTTIGLNNVGLRRYSATSELPKRSVDLSENDTYLKRKENPGDDGKTGPTQEQLEHVYNTLQEDLPRFFVTSLNYKIYHKDLEFINNFKGTTTKVGGHVIYAYVKFDILKITMHPEDNTVKVRWRIRGMSGFKVFTSFWKLRFLKLTESMQPLESWYDGLSTYFVGPDGLVYRHIADKMMPDNETVSVKDKTDIAAKLAA